ncbi:Uma2 family endonuclease [Vulgatibacter incomptus]|uniref:Putative restriction endonuclease domain-containing protein n=1 Tax=Vulgatibacter incomptus TaxID=1391653 RepID=A0A0K1PHA5_9BACT|nr:Uma2 family endonuclease [Vulgatibacter incomptus]AKU92504.1 hypothetical protein AKJ08_2891 [Vulgatibacter incomptus]
MTAKKIGKRPATYEQLEALPEHLIGEIVEGELWASPRPGNRHAMVSSALGGELYGPFQIGRNGPGGWWIVDEPELHLGSDVLVPDLAGWRKESLPVPPDAPFFELPPDWVCEVLSPSTARLDRIRKIRLYARAGVRYVWLLDPLERSLQVLRSEHSRFLIVGGFEESERARAEPFEELELDLEALWGPMPPRGEE